MNVSIIVASHGHQEWAELAETRACCSAMAELPHELIVLHGEGETSLAQTRNEAASRATGDWLLFLDADDELHPGFLMEIHRARVSPPVLDLAVAYTSPLLLTPAVEYVPARATPKGVGKVWPEMPLRQGNWLVIGTVLPRDLFTAVGGFREWPLYEDWDLWQRCELEGAQIVPVPDALYIAHVDPSSRNRSLPPAERARIHRAIVEANYGA